jgi:hypothetical protein
VRDLTSAEARAIQALLARNPGQDGVSDPLGVIPRTTYQAIRRRAFDSGWLYERFVPAPAAIGSSGVSIRLIQPFSERRSDLVRQLRSDPSVVVLFASPETVLSVAYDFKDSPRDLSDSSHRGDHEQVRRSWTISVGLATGQLPVYFDYEGGWARLLDGDSTFSYPQPLPESNEGARPANTSEVRRLLARPFDHSDPNRSSIRLSPLYLPGRQRRLLLDGNVAQRVFPNLPELPAFRGSRIQRLVFITGRLNGHASVAALLSRLHAECGVSPFLALGDGIRVLIGTLSPAPPGRQRSRRPAMEVLSEGLFEIEVIREPVDTFFPVVAHRYDRLLSTGDDSGC